MTGLPPDAGPPAPLLRDEDQLCAVLDMDFSKEQLAAITAEMAPGAIIAGAGSGKTTVMAARVVWLVGRRLVTPDEVLGLTFTNKAAAELGARVRAALRRLYLVNGPHPPGVEWGEPTVSTYHAYAGALVAEHGLRLGFEPDLRLVADASRYQRAAKVVQQCSASLPTVSTDLATVVRDLVRLDGQLSEHLADVDRVLRFDTELREVLAELEQLRHVKDTVRASLKRDELLQLVARYRAAKAADGVADFSDQMASGARLATQSPKVSRCERSRYRVVLLDEYQDTSVSQRLMLQGLFSGATPADGRGHAVTAVGDPCQAIYGWRGASADNLDAFPEHFPDAAGRASTAYELVVNRRCDQDVLAVANALAAPLYAVHRNVQPLEPRSGAQAGSIRSACLETVVDEIDWLVEQISSVRDEPGLDAGARWSDVAVLVRDGNEIGAVAAELRHRQVPVEVVGLSGLLTQPEVADVVATLEVLHSLTANAALLRLLTGPRWRIGARDLALLGERAGQLSREPPPQVEGDLADRLGSAVTRADPTEVLSLSDALEDPGSLGYSAAALSRFAALSAELGTLRSSVGSPLVDVVRRVIETIGLDVELGVDPGPDATQARDNIALLLEAVADFAATDPFASLNGLLAYLGAEGAYNAGMVVATPSAGDSVKLLTVHKAKGLEWQAVFVPFLAATVFPNERGRDRWTSTAAELPFPLRGDAASLPAINEWSTAGMAAFKEAVRDQGMLEERRLVYVALTRAKRVLVASGHWWGRTQKGPRGPSDYLTQLHELANRGDATDPWVGNPEDNATNPLLAAHAVATWPATLDLDKLSRRRLAAQAVRDALESPAADDPAVASPAGRQLTALDAEIDALLADAAQAGPDTVEVPLPAMLSTTAAMRMRTDPDGFAAALARPMPQRPSPAGRFGTRFHAWVEAYVGQQALLEPHDLPGAADSDITDDSDLAALTEAFRRGPFGDRVPCAVEAPFSLTLRGQVLIGRIDAVYATGDRFTVIDWKTNREASADPIQLAVYRLAWAEMHGLPLERVSAAFYYVRTGEVSYAELPDRAALEVMLMGPP